eukprot:COSAG02_NODE_873_length_16302_cov_113.473616_17_plen_171_part_00
MDTYLCSGLLILPHRGHSLLTFLLEILRQLAGCYNVWRVIFNDVSNTAVCILLAFYHLFQLSIYSRKPVEHFLLLFLVLGFQPLPNVIRSRHRNSLFVSSRESSGISLANSIDPFLHQPKSGSLERSLKLECMMQMASEVRICRTKAYCTQKLHHAVFVDWWRIGRWLSW